MLDLAEAAAVAAAFGVSDQQVRRDHLISHLLAVLARQLPGAVVFFGGTADRAPAPSMDVQQPANC